MKKIFYLCSTIGSVLLLASCSVGKAYDTSYLLNLVDSVNNSSSKEIPTSETAIDENAAKNIFDKYVSSKKDNNYVTIKNEIIYSCLNFVAEKGGDKLIEADKSFYELNKDDSIQSLYNEKKIIIQTKVTNFNFEWNSDKKYWAINNCALILAIQFRENYLITTSGSTIEKGSTISYDFILQSMYLNYVLTENLDKNKFESSKEINYIGGVKEENACGIVEAQINGKNPPLKTIKKIVARASNKKVNDFFVNKK